MLDREKLVEAFESLRAKLVRLAVALGVLTALGYWQAPLIAAILQKPGAVHSFTMLPVRRSSRT